MLMQLPDRRQQTEHSCGHAAIDSVLSFFNLPECGRVTLANAVDGMDPATVEAVLRSKGLSVLSGTMTVRDLKHLCDSGRPVLCPVSWAGGHWVVVAGVERRGVYYQDPAEGPKRKGVQEFLNAWRDGNRSGRHWVTWGIAASVPPTRPDSA